MASLYVVVQESCYSMTVDVDSDILDSLSVNCSITDSSAARSCKRIDVSVTDISFETNSVAQIECTGSGKS